MANLTPAQQAQVNAISQQLSNISSQVSTIAQAKAAGMSVSGSTSSEQAQAYLNQGTTSTPQNERYSSQPYTQKSSLVENQIAQLKNITYPQTATYTIKAGDTLSGLANRYGTTTSAIQKLNPQITNPNLIYAGNSLNLPTISPVKVNSYSTDNGVNLPEKISTDALRSVLNITAKTNNYQIPQEVPENLVDNMIVSKINSDYQRYSDLLNQLSTQTQTSRADELKSLYNEYGITETFSQLKSLTTQAASIRTEIEKLNAQEQDALKTADQQMAPMSYINGNKMKISNDYASQRANLAAQLSSYTTQAEMLQNNISMARTFASDLVDAATYDQEWKAKQLQAFISLNQDMISQLGKDYQDALDETSAQYNQEYQLSKNQRQQIVNWATDSDTFGAFMGTDLSSISFEDAAQKVQSYLQLKAVTNNETIDKSFWSAINKGLNELQQGENWGNVWNRIKMQFPNASDEKIDNALGISWREPGAYQQFKTQNSSASSSSEAFYNSL